MRQYKILTLTDHRGHSSENSIYAILSKMIRHLQCKQVDVASRGNIENDDFFYNYTSDQLQVVKVTDSFSFSHEGASYLNNTRTVSIKDYDFIFIRLPRPIPDGFFDYLTMQFPSERIINNPKSIDETGSKAFLLNFPDICPPIQLCQSLEDIKAFARHFTIVLKPLRNYGGDGIVKVDKDMVHISDKIIPFEQYVPDIQNELERGGYLAMKFLENVSEGDKRILVVNGKILGASLRIPAPGAWMCNVAQGGTSVYSEPTTTEIKIVETINPILKSKGILIYGVDTLTDDNGQRILSEINTLSIGGFPQTEAQTGRPVVQQLVDLVFEYFNKTQ